MTPTPDRPRTLPTARLDADEYVVQPGDTLGTIAQNFGISVEDLMQANGLQDENLIAVDMTLYIPSPDPGVRGPSFKVIPDSELVYGPAAAQFDVGEFVKSKGGYLSAYTEEVDGEILSGAEIVLRVSQNYSVNPRLLLSLLEFESHWVTDPFAFQTDYPLGFVDEFHVGLYRQLTWASNELNRGYYLWRANAVSAWVLGGDGTVVPVDPTINAGTAAVQNLFSQMDDRTTWEQDAGPFGLFQSYFFLFGNPFDRAIEPLVPQNLQQPRLSLPFARGETWSFTGGPHGAWDAGSAWAALDFAPPGEAAGCVVSDAWVTAVADGPVVRAHNGVVMQDLDNDGYEQTGWVIFYMHIEIRERVEPGTYVLTNERIGHPSCEGGMSNGTHVHIARKYNGEWISADGRLPLNLDGWVSSGNGIQYDGFLSRGTFKVEAWDGVNELNQITR
jgi:LasA protease